MVVIFVMLQIAQNRSHVQTLGPKVGIVYILEAPGFFMGSNNMGPNIPHAQGLATEHVAQPSCSKTLCQGKGLNRQSRV